MKKLLLAAVLTFTVGSAFAQREMLFGVKLGGNFSTILGGGTGGIMGKSGFHAGVTVDYGFNDELFLVSGLELTRKGFKGEVSLYGLPVVKVTGNAYYVQLPIHLAYKFDVGLVKLVPELGPYFAYGIGGKMEAEADGLLGGAGDYFGDPKKGYCKAFDLGIGVAFGVELGRIGVKIGYDYGLLNIDFLDDYRNINGNLYLSVGCKF
ncbi:MAG: PorT family protein [Bacteroidales bacterium]|nr:PorT family protein [Bacteroidales bacterium]